jgi:hypothetical protein
VTVRRDSLHPAPLAALMGNVMGNGRCGRMKSVGPSRSR